MRPRFRSITALWVVVPLVVVSACATIIHGTKQDVNISSSPASASVTVDGTNSGATPVTVNLRRKEDHLVRITLAGYAPFEVKIEHKMSGWFWGNLLIGGLIGIIVDASNGAMYKLTPDQVSASLSRGDHAASADVLYLTVAMKVDPSLQKIGQLIRVP